MENTAAVMNEIESLRQENADLRQQVKLLLDELRLARHKRFGSSSERSDGNQVPLNLFNEAEAEAKPDAEEPTIETLTYERRKKQSGQ